MYTVKENETVANLTVMGISGVITNAAGVPTFNPVVPAGQNLGDSKNITIDSPFIPPSITTGAATLISSGSATLNGAVTVYNSPATISFEYGQTLSYGTVVTATPDSATGRSATPVSAATVNLTPGASYHYRLAVTNNSTGITYYGNHATFTLSPPVSTGYTVSGSVVLNKGGSISCSSPITSGGSSICKLTPATGWYIASLTDNAIDSVPVNNPYTITNITADHAVEVMYQEYLVRRLSGLATNYHLNIQDAINYAVNNDKLMLLAMSFPGAVVFNKPASLVEVEGGYESGFLSKSGFSEINGRVDIRNGKVVMKGIKIK
jgi:hypothetical protein